MFIVAQEQCSECVASMLGLLVKNKLELIWKEWIV